MENPKVLSGKPYKSVDTTPMPDSVPKVEEVGSTSAPLLSASYFIGARCRPYNDDFMQCKAEAFGRGPIECLKEGRKVSRCAASVISDMRAKCLEQFRSHWDCLENHNHQLKDCRIPERKLNNCMYNNFGLEKHLPDAHGVPVHLRQRQIFAEEPQTEEERQGSWRNPMGYFYKVTKEMIDEDKKNLEINAAGGPGKAAKASQ